MAIMDNLFRMDTVSARYKSYNDRWKFKNGSCTALHMAKAGFFKLVGDDDDVQCPWCLKCLDGWKSTDIPYEEHKKHTRQCPYVLMFPDNPPNQLTHLQCINLMEAAIKLKFVRQANEVKEELNKVFRTANKKKIRRNK